MTDVLLSDYPNLTPLLDAPPLIVGANSNLGKNLVQELDKLGIKHLKAIRCFESNCSHELHDNSFCVSQGGKLETKLQLIPQSTIYLFATHYTRDVNQYSEIIKCNITYLGNLIQSLKPIIKKVVYTNTYMSLSNNFQPKSVYAKSKKFMGDYFEDYCSNFGIDYSNIHTFDIWGGNDSRQKLPQLLAKSLSNPKNRISLSEGNQLIAPIHISDAVRTLINIVGTNSQYGKNILLHGAETNTLKNIVNNYLEYARKRIEIEWGGLPYNGDEIFILPSGYFNIVEKFRVESTTDLIQLAIENR